MNSSTMAPAAPEETRGLLSRIGSKAMSFAEKNPALVMGLGAAALGAAKAKMGMSRKNRKNRKSRKNRKNRKTHRRR